MDLIKKLLLCFLILIAKETFSCSCVNTPLLEKYQRSDFIATIKILKVIQDENNKDYHDIDFELINLYKGASINKLKIESVLNSSCSFLPSENTTWLVFASKDHNGFLSFGACSGSEQIDREFDLAKYPNLDVKYKKSIDLKLKVLDFIKGNKLAIDNKFKLMPIDYRLCLDGLKGFNEKDRFAVYELIVNRSLSIENIRILKRFNNKDLSKKLTDCLRDNLKITARNVDAIPEKAKIIMIYFYYSAEKENPSFISLWDL
ncbi:MAG: hypothetical protein WAZ36_11145 [Sediminibacterium sp.]